MGGTTFDFFANQPDIKKAFSGAIEDARHEYGHRPYTGTIAEKAGYGYVIISREPMTLKKARDKAEELLDEGDKRVDDKFGPAGAIRVKDDESKHNGWLFFGWASC